MIGADEFVAGLHVADREAGDDPGQQRQKIVCRAVKKRPPGRAGAEDDGGAGLCPFPQAGNVIRIIFKISVLDKDMRAPSRRDP